MAKSLLSATPSDDSTFFQEMQNKQSALEKQALEVFRATEKHEKELQMDEQGAHKSRQLLESLTTGKSFTQLYDEAVNEQEKQRLLTTQISQTISNEQLTFEQKKEIVDQLEQSCGNQMYVIAFNTLIEKHAISPCFTPEYYQQLITIDTEIQARRDLEITDFMQIIHELMQTSTTVTDPIARQDIVLKMGIIMILGSGINVRKIHEAELMRLKQEFASLFFTIDPWKNETGTKKLLKTIQKSYTSIELNADLHRIYPPLEKFVEMIDQLLEISKHKEPDLSYAWKNFAFMHHAISTMHRDKMANVIDNVIRELKYTGEVKHNQKIGELRNVIQDDPKKLQDYFMLMYYIVDAGEHSPKISDHLGDLGIADSFKYTVANTQRQRSLQEIYNFDVQTVSPEVMQLLAWNDVTFPFKFFLETRGRERCAEHLTKEWVLRHIRSGDNFKDHLDLKSLIEKVGLETLKSHPDGMWILMKCMTEKLKGASYSDLQIDAYGNTYCRQRAHGELEYMTGNSEGGTNYHYGVSPGEKLFGHGLDGRTHVFGNERRRDTKIDGAYFVSEKDMLHDGEGKKYVIFKNLEPIALHPFSASQEIVGNIDQDYILVKGKAGYECYATGGLQKGSQPVFYLDDPNVFLHCISDGLIMKIDRSQSDEKVSYINTLGQTEIVLDEKYVNAGDFHEGLAQVAQKHTKGIVTTYTYGFIDKMGKEVIPCMYDGVTDFSEGLARVWKDGKGNFVNQKNERALSLPEYFSKIDKNAGPEKQEFHLQQAHPFSCGFTRVEYKTKMHPARFGEQGSPEFRTRFYDTTGKLLKFPGSMIITAASDFCGGIAKVQTIMNGDFSRGLIDTFGNYYPVSG